MMPTKLAISYMNILTFLLIKETFKFWANVKDHLPSPSTHKIQYCYKELHVPVLNWGLWHGRSNFSPSGGRISTAQVSYDLDLQIFWDSFYKK